MKTVYEAQASIHIPSLKCSYPRGTRFTVENDIVSVGDLSVELNNEFKILIKRKFVKKLSEKELSTPEKVETPKTLPEAERKKMKVEMAEDLSRPVKIISEDEKIINEKDDTETDNTKSIRGMKVTKPESTPIAPRNQKKVDEKSLKEIESRKAARVKAANAAIEASKKEKKELSDAQKEALAKARAAATEKRKASQNAENTSSQE